jgi:hypothetical protein
MGASELDSSQLNKVIHIEGWAVESKNLHSRECTEKYCGGKSKIWWMVRHPRLSPSVASDASKRFAIEKYHVCSLILDRLERGIIPWLPKERRRYLARTDEEIFELLGRTVPQKAISETAQETREALKNPFPGAVPPREHYQRMPVQETHERYRNGRKLDDAPAKGFSATIDALSRKR